MSEEKQPYEVMNEGEPHAEMDWLAKVIGLLMLALIILVASACPAKAANNWCGQYADGYLTGYCWTRKRCDYVPPVVCPAPVSADEDAYMAGLRDGLAAGRVEL